MTSSTNERVFIIGGTGNAGSVAVRNLIAKNVPITLYARNPSKVESLFPDTDKSTFNVVQGDIADLDPLMAALPGHTRLFLLVNDLEHLAQIKSKVAQIAYAAGIKQIVDISSLNVTAPWRSHYIATTHREAEEAILKAATAHNANVVTLRPTRFMSNLMLYDRPGPDSIVDTADPEKPQGWISPNDIGALAAVILTEDIKKHGDGVYEMVGDVITPTQRADIFSRVLGRPITYQEITPATRYNAIKDHLSFFAFSAIYDLVIYVDHRPLLSRGLPILLGREPETFEAYVRANKDALA